MRKLLIVAALMTVGFFDASRNTSFAADLGKPKDMTFEDLLKAKAPQPQSTTCYVETSVAGTFLRDTREAQAGIGGGCDAKLYNLIIGGGLRADISDWQNTGSVFMKLGVAINSANTIYGLAEWKVPEWKIDKAGQVAIGAGAELKLELINPGLWLFGESTFAATKWGQATKDDLNVRTGLRLRF